MRTQTQTIRRQNVAAGGWSRNYNTVRHTATTTKKIGSISNTIIVCLLVLIVGLIYTSQGTRATSYDYQLSEIENEISELEAKREDLAVERARLTSVATADNNEVAANMENASVEGWAE